MYDAKTETEDSTADGMRTVKEQARQVTVPDDLQLLREKDNHDKDMESRDLQLWLAKIVIISCLLLGATSLVIGLTTRQETAIQLGMSLLTTILGVVLGFMFKR